MYNEEKLYSVRSLVVVHILNFQRDLVVMRFICIEFYYYLLTPWCRVLLEKLTGLQLVKKFPVFHGTRRFTKMYNEEKLYSVRSLVLVHILNFQRYLVVMRFIRIELITCSTSKVDRVKVHIHFLRDVL